MTFGDKIKILREDYGLTQAQVAELIPMNQSNYSKIERGRQEPDLEQLKRLAEIFDVSADYLIGLKNDDSVVKSAVFARRVIDLYNEIYK